MKFHNSIHADTNHPEEKLDVAQDGDKPGGNKRLDLNMEPWFEMQLLAFQQLPVLSYEFSVHVFRFTKSPAVTRLWEMIEQHGCAKSHKRTLTPKEIGVVRLSAPDFSATFSPVLKMDLHQIPKIPDMKKPQTIFLFKPGAICETIFGGEHDHPKQF